MYTIHYDGGEPLQNVGQNGDLFVVSGSLSQERLSGVLRNVRIEGTAPDGEDDKSGEYALMRCGYFCDKGDVVEFVLREYPADELRYEGLAGKLEYLAMMSGVEL